MKFALGHPRHRARLKHVLHERRWCSALGGGSVFDEDSLAFELLHRPVGVVGDASMQMNGNVMRHVQAEDEALEDSVWQKRR